MPQTTQFELVSPERVFFSEPVEMVVVPGTEGDFAALPDVLPMVAMVRPGLITIFENEKPKERIFVAGGVAEVDQTSCIVLAEEAYLLSELKEEDAQARYEAAMADFQRGLASFKGSSVMAPLETELDVARAMMTAIRGEFSYPAP